MKAMLRKSLYTSLSVCIFALPVSLVPTSTFAQESTQEKKETKDENAGQAKLDEATDLKLDANTIDALSTVITLCEEAMAAGLDESNTAFAKELLSSSAFQRAQMTMQELVQSRISPQALRRARTKILADLQKSIDNDPKMIDAYLMMARLRMLGQERKEAIAAIDKAIENATEDKRKLAEAYLVRSQIREDISDKLTDLQLSLQADSSNQEAWQARIALLITQDKFDEAYKDVQELLNRDEENIFAIQAAVQCLVSLERIDEAIDLLSKRVEAMPENADFRRVRARLYLQQKKDDLALEDLNKAIELNPQDVESMLMRCEYYLNKEEIELAQQDVEDALLLQPNLVSGIIFRSLIAARQKRYDDAIRDMQTLVRADPENPGFLLQLAGYYQMDDRPNQAIKVTDEVISKYPDNYRAYRLRGDSLLAIGEHSKALADYEKALEVVPVEEKEDRSGLLNNLAWVLATSPVDELRNGERSIKLGTEACEMTEYKEAHILSTLAAAYAETGNFAEALKWAEKAVELGKEEESEQLEQLQKELDSYKENKPWREKQDTKEKKAPLPTTGGVDT
jgi:tetratricopeptide (TPR) repeat protein